MKLLLLFGILFLFGCKNNSRFRIEQKYEYYEPYWGLRIEPVSGWYLNTTIYDKKRILKTWAYRTDEPDTAYAQYIKEARKYLAEKSIFSDTTIYIK